MLSALNTNAVGYGAVALFLLTALADPDVRNAIVAVFTNPTPSSILGALGVVAAFAVAYYSRPHTVPDSTLPPPSTPPSVLAPSQVRGI